MGPVARGPTLCKEASEAKPSVPSGRSHGVHSLQIDLQEASPVASEPGERQAGLPASDWPLFGFL